MEWGNFQRMFRSFIFGELTKGSKGVELPCKFRMCPNRVHPVQNGMPFCETCLSSPPRLQRFLRGLDTGKAASERALLFPHLPPQKSSESSKGKIVVLWFFAGDGWVENNALFQRIVFCSPITKEKSLGCRVANPLMRQLPENRMHFHQKCLHDTAIHV